MKMEKKISAVYKIVNTVTGYFYVGSSKNVKSRWGRHKSPSRWKRYPNNPLYQDFQKYGIDKFRLQILAPVMEEHLKQVEQEFIEMLHPAYNSINAKGLDVERAKATSKKYEQSEKRKEFHRKVWEKYYDRICSYNGETLTLNTLRSRFHRAGIKHPTLEAKKYLIKEGE